MKDTKQKLSWIANYEAAFWNLPSTNWKASCEKKDYPPFWMTFASIKNFHKKWFLWDRFHEKGRFQISKMASIKKISH